MLEVGFVTYSGCKTRVTQAKSVGCCVRRVDPTVLPPSPAHTDGKVCCGVSQGAVLLYRRGRNLVWHNKTVPKLPWDLSTGAICLGVVVVQAVHCKGCRVQNLGAWDL